LPAGAKLQTGASLAATSLAAKASLASTGHTDRHSSGGRITAADSCPLLNRYRSVRNRRRLVASHSLGPGPLRENWARAASCRIGTCPGRLVQNRFRARVETQAARNLLYLLGGTSPSRGVHDQRRRRRMSRRRRGGDASGAAFSRHGRGGAKSTRLKRPAGIELATTRSQDGRLHRWIPNVGSIPNM
jgi:hypothetical protein